MIFRKNIKLIFISILESTLHLVLRLRGGAKAEKGKKDTSGKAPKKKEGSGGGKAKKKV